MVFDIARCFFFTPRFHTEQRHDEVHRAEQHEMSTTSQYISRLFHTNDTLRFELLVEMQG